ncbi:MAG: DNA mismatch repair protein MutS [Candidatus Binataceae bacterium]|nr:DNA mismatch repair protein MutS [Candidatus Binataceae bacterium]
MTFQSILYPDRSHGVSDAQCAAPECFVDLNLDQVVAAITVGKDEYDLTPFFHTSLRDVDAITYRHEVMRALEDVTLADSIKSFAEKMHAMRQHLAQSGALSGRQKERWFLDAMNVYCDAVTRLVHDLSHTELTSRGLIAFREYMTRYAASESFASLLKETKEIHAEICSIDYCVLIDSPHVQVRKSKGESDYSADVQATFERFRRGAVTGFHFRFRDSPEMDHIEEKVHELVARLYPDIFARLHTYCSEHKDYPDEAIFTFDREIQFYIAYLDHIAKFKKAGLDFCYPRITTACKEVYSYRGFDLALANKLIGECAIPVRNDFHLKGRERIIVVSGPNQGGKTTFARTFGQLHYLASLGCPVPGSKAQLFLFDELFTHFEREESISNLRGKLHDDLVRVHQILNHATPNSIIIMNEIFTSTTLQDAIALSKRIATKLLELDLLCVWVTFVDELASLGEQTVSMVSTMVPGSPALRTYEVVRRPADGLSYATSIAEKYRLTYKMIMERIGW